MKHRKHLMLGVVLCVISAGTVPVFADSASDREAVNRFYRNVVDAVRAESDPWLKSLTVLVHKQSNTARQCLAELTKKLNEPGERGRAFQMLHARLDTAILLAGAGSACDESIYRALIDKLRQDNWDRQDRLLVAQELTARCPSRADAYYLLGDLYLEDQRAGMAIQAYEKGLALKDDADSRKCLAEARMMMERYQKQEPITQKTAQDFARSERTMGPVLGTVRKVEPDVCLQRQVLFDEWSHQIKEQFIPEINTLGQAVRQELAQTTGCGLVILGHTDKRGPLEKNMKLSLERAEAVKAHLVKSLGIDPSRIKTEGCGPTRPYDPRDNEEGWRLNRRVEFKKVPLGHGNR